MKIIKNDDRSKRFNNTVSFAHKSFHTSIYWTSLNAEINSLDVTKLFTLFPYTVTMTAVTSNSILL